MFSRASSDGLLLQGTCHRSTDPPRLRIVIEIATLTILSLYGENGSTCVGVLTGFSVLPHESILNQKQFIVVLLLTNFQSFIIRALDSNYELMLVRLVVLKVEQ